MNATSAPHLHQLLRAGRNAVGIEHLRRQDLQLLLGNRSCSTAGCLEELSFRLREAVLEAAETRWCVAHIASAPRRRNPNLLVHGGDLYLFGGYSVHDRYIEDRNVLLKYDATTGRFEGVGIVQGNESKVPEARAGATAAVYDDKLWVFGGEDGYQTLSDMHVFDFQTGLWHEVDQQGEQPTPRATVYCTIFDGHLLIYGFEDDGEGIEDPNSIMTFEFATGTWKRMKTEGPSPGDQAYVQALALRAETLMYVLAFKGGSPFLRGEGILHVHALNLATRKWSHIKAAGEPPSPRAFFSAAVLGDNWIVQGGICANNSDSSAGKPNNDIFAFNFATEGWFQIKVGQGQVELQRRSRHAAAILHDSIVYVGGSVERQEESPRSQAMVESSFLSPEGTSGSSMKDNGEAWHRVPGADIVEALQLVPVGAEPPTTAVLNTQLSQQLQSLLSHHLVGLSDMELVVEGRSFHVHRLILSLQSPAFASMFQAGMLEQQNARVELQDVDATTMDAFLCYLYGGLPHMDPPVLAPLFRAADRFQVEPLTEECQQRLVEGVRLDNFTEMVALADDLSCEPLWQACVDLASDGNTGPQALQSAALQGLADARPQVVQRLAEECMQTGSGMKTSNLEA